MNFNRIISLFRYDFRMERKRLFWWFGGVLGFIAFVALRHIFLQFDYYDNLSLEVATSMRQWIGFAIFLTPFVLMHSVQDKYTIPRSSLGYLNLPGSTAEKFTVMVLEFVLVPAALYACYIVLFYLVMGIGALAEPDCSWAYNVFQIQSLQEQMSTITTMSMQMNSTAQDTANLVADNVLENNLIYTIASWCLSVMLLQIYVMINVKNSGRSQVKSAVTLFLSVAVIGFALVWLSVQVISHLDMENVQLVMSTWLDNLRIVCNILACLVPLVNIGLFYAMYRQLKKRQAK